MRIAEHFMKKANEDVATSSSSLRPQVACFGRIQREPPQGQERGHVTLGVVTAGVEYEAQILLPRGFQFTSVVRTLRWLVKTSGPRRQNWITTVIAQVRVLKFCGRIAFSDFTQFSRDVHFGI